jgi:hypothetical protein
VYIAREEGKYKEEVGEGEGGKDTKISSHSACVSFSCTGTQQQEKKTLHILRLLTAFCECDFFLEP